ncbi:MAG TPA: HAD-IA family hydrolase [Tepidisphaeraceae bacterium]|nr:HAD-IA family hydrolase [Tepidisphaeraceae bacterium]
MQPIQPPPKAIIFDMDGTLADTFPLVVAAWNAALSRHAGRDFSAEEVIARFGIPDPAMIRRELPEHLGDEAVEAYHLHYEQQHAGLARAFEGVCEMLEGIQQRGLPRGVMTGKGRQSAMISLRALGWERMFDAVVTGEDVARQKPDPEGLFLVARQLGVSPRDCVFVGDSPADIGAGKNAAMRTIVAGWHPVYLEHLRAMGFDYWAQTPADVVKLLGSGEESPTSWIRER